MAIRFVAPARRETPVAPMTGTVVVGATGVVLPVGEPPPAAPLEAPVSTNAHNEAVQDACREFDVHVVEMRAAGFSVREIARETHSNIKRIERALRRAREAGILHDVENDLKHDIVPLAVEKLRGKVAAGDWDAIRETLRGTGTFRTFSQNKSDITERSMTLAVNFTLPEDRPPLVVNPRNIIGTPREERHGEEALVGQGARNPA